MSSDAKELIESYLEAQGIANKAAEEGELPWGNDFEAWLEPRRQKDVADAFREYARQAIAADRATRPTADPTCYLVRCEGEPQTSPYISREVAEAIAKRKGGFVVPLYEECRPTAHTAGARLQQDGDPALR